MYFSNFEMGEMKLETYKEWKEATQTNNSRRAENKI